MRLIRFRKWNDVAGKERILLLLKSRCCRFVSDLNGRFGISEIEEDRPWDILNVNKEWPTCAQYSYFIIALNYILKRTLDKME